MVPWSAKVRIAAIALVAGCASWSSKTARFSGTVTAADCGCWGGGPHCSVTVGTRDIRVGVDYGAMSGDYSHGVWGRLEGLRSCEDAIGLEADVYVHKSEIGSADAAPTYSLEGSSEYFVRLRPRK